MSKGDGHLAAIYISIRLTKFGRTNLLAADA